MSRYLARLKAKSGQKPIPYELPKPKGGFDSFDSDLGRGFSRNDGPPEANETEIDERMGMAANSVSEPYLNAWAVDRVPADLVAPLFKPTSASGGQQGFEHPCVPQSSCAEERQSDLFLHFCVECGRWGSFGYGVHLGAGRLGRWYCGAHRPSGKSR